MTARVRSWCLVFITLATGLLPACRTKQDVNEPDAARLVSVVRSKADSLQWGRPLRLTFSASWPWDSVYFVEWYEYALDVPTGSKNAIDADEDAEDYTHLFFTSNGQISKHLRIRKSLCKLGLNTCTAGKTGYSSSQEYYFANCGDPPYNWIDIFPSDCDSLSIFRSVRTP